MSVAEFSAALKEQAYKRWFKASRKNILAAPVKEFRAAAERAERTNFFLSTDTLIQIAEKLAGRQISEQETDVLVGDLVGLIDGKKAVLIQEEVEKGTKTVTGVYFRQVSFADGIDNILKKSLQSITDRIVVDDRGTSRPARISDFFEKGHVFGVATNVTTETARNLARSKVNQEAKDKLLRTLVRVRNALLKQDIETANIKDMKFSLYSKYLKTPYKYLVEMQLKEVNQAAGRQTTVFTNALRRYFSTDTNAAVIAKDLRTRDSEGDKFIAKILSAKGSPSYIDLMKDELLNSLNPKRRKKQNRYTIAETKITDVVKKVDTTKLRKSTKTSLAAIDKAISQVKSIVIPQPVVISNLEAILRARIRPQVVHNMGTGTSKDVLNYRTGRFADSVKIDKVMESRTGLISVFYSYMKNPYATFSAGGMREYPRSRDPKALISKSIREIAADNAVTRLRAILA